MKSTIATAMLRGAVLLLLPFLAAAQPHRADVVIYGGTSAGIVAAVQAAKMGKKVILVEAGQHLGGMAAEGLGDTDIDNHAGIHNSPAVGGLALELYRRIAARYGRQAEFDALVARGGKDSHLWRFEPHVAEAVFDEWVEEAGVEVLRGHRLRERHGVTMENRRITSIACENGAVVEGRVFIDATYEGDLLAFAGLSFAVGREGNARYQETKNGLRLDSRHAQIDRTIDPYVRPGDPSSGLIHGVQAAPPGRQGDADDGIQGYCFRLCLTRAPDRRPIEKPANYDPAHYELQRRYLAAGGTFKGLVAAMPNGKSMGSGHMLASNFTGFNHRYPVASYAERAEMLRTSLDHIRGLYWFLANDPAVPAAIGADWKQWGLTTDEFTDNGGWPRAFYVRNGRRLVGDFVLTEAHLRRDAPEPVADSVGLIWWPPDLHHARCIPENGQVWLEGAEFDASKNPSWIPCGIPYRALVPKAAEGVNLLTPTCPSASYVAYGAYRIEFTFMVAGQSCATAAALAIDSDLPVQQVDPQRLRDVLLAQGQVLAVPAAAAAAAPTRYDVVVYGGTPGGIMAAVAAARDGASVLIIEQKRHVGGLTTSGLCNDEVHHMHPWSIGGLSREFYERLGRAYGRPPIAEVWQERTYNTWESKVAQRVFDEMLAEAKVPVRYGLRVTEVAKDGPRIRHIVLTDGSRVSGKVFLDCTYEGDLMARSGVRYTFGRESSGQYGESLAGIRLGDKRVKAKTRDVDGRLLPGISATIDQLEPGGADRMVQNYNFRLTLTQDENNRVPFPRPRDYDPRRYALLANYLAEHPDTKLKGIFAYGSIGNGKFEANNHQNAIISLGHFGGQRDYPDADYETQDRIHQDHVDYTQGLLWFLLHDPAVPEPLRRETATWGLAKDEFTDNGNWPYYLYIREARRMIGRFVMTQKDVQTDRSKDDSVLLGSHYIDCHHLQRVAVNDDEFTNDGRIWVPGKVYEIPYRSLTPEAEQCDNLLVPVAASFSHVAFCPYRLEPTWMAAGHSTGLAAAMAARSGMGVQQIDVAELQKRLESQGQPLKLRDDR